MALDIQGNTILLKLFTACFESIFQQMKWEGKGVRINGEYFNHLWFVDIILQMPESSNKLQEILNNLNREKNSLKVGLKVNRNLIKIILNCNVPKKIIRIKDEKLEEIQKYIYYENEIKWHDWLESI